MCRIIVIIFAIILSGCEFRQTSNAELDYPTRYTVQAWGYPKQSGGVRDDWFYSININVESAPEFYVVMPDGHYEKSKSINESVLLEHYPGITKFSLSEYGERKITNEERYWLIFSFNEYGALKNINAYSCNHIFNKLFMTDNRMNQFDFPIRKSELNQVFKGRFRIGNDFEIFGGSCE